MNRMRMVFWFIVFTAAAATIALMIVGATLNVVRT